MGLQKKLKKLEQAIDDLKSMVNSLKEENAMLRKEVTELKEKDKSKKDSSNSSIPPSQDQNRVKKNTSLRKKQIENLAGSQVIKALLWKCQMILIK